MPQKPVGWDDPGGPARFGPKLLHQSNLSRDTARRVTYHLNHLTPSFRKGCRTVGRLARVLAAANDREFRVSEEPATEDDPIWDRLCNVLVRELGVRREELRRETRFVEDLGF